MTKRLETKVSQEAHERIESDPKYRKVKRAGSDALYFIQPGGEWDGESWIHEVLKAEDCPIQ